MTQGGRASRLLDLKPGEGRPVGLAVCVSFFAYAGLMIGGSGIEALFFARYGVSKLPSMYLLLGATMFLVSLGLGALIGRMGRARACLVIPIVLAGLAAAGRFVLAGDASWVTQALWLLQGMSQFVVGWVIWGLAGIVADTRQAKRFFPLIGAGGVLGFVVGGLVTHPVASAIGTANLIMVWVATLLVTVAFGARLVSLGGAERARPVTGRREARGPIAELREGLGYVRRSHLMRWLSLGSVLFSLLFFSLYLPFSRAATTRYPDPDDLAGFFGLFFGVSTGVAFLLSLFVTNRLLARFGAPSVILVLPLLYVVAFGVLSVQASFAILAAFRFIQVAWMQGGANSSWEAIINTVPPERRDQTRAFLYGGPTQVGTVLAGIVALLGERAVSPRALYGIGLGAGLLAVWAMIGARRGYPRELVRALREGRPSVFGAPVTGADPFAAAGADRQGLATAIEALSDPDPRLRRVAAQVLGDLEPTVTTEALVSALRDEDPVVRATALRSLATADRAEGPATEITRSLLMDPDPDVRARAAALLLRSVDDPEAERVLVSLAVDADAEVRRSALRAMQGLTSPRLFEVARFALSDGTASVRGDAARAAASIDPSRALQPLVDALTEVNRPIHEALGEALGTIGAAAVEPVVASLDSPDHRAGALTALEHLPLDVRSEELRRFAAQAVSQAVARHRAGAGVEAGADERLQLLRDSLLVRAEREAVLALRAAALLGGAGAITVALENLSVTDPAQRANALEVIESVGARQIVRPLLSMWDGAPHGADERPDRQALLDRLRQDPDDWIRACAELARDEGGAMTRTLATLPLMERVLFLRKVPLFAELASPDLHPIASIAEEEAFDDGETIAEQGDAGDVMYIIVNGEVAIAVSDGAGSREIAVRGPGDAVGEMAVLTNEPRIATLVARGEVRVLSIDRRRFEAIIRERPETSLGVIKVLCQRLAEPQAGEPRSGPAAP